MSFFHCGRRYLRLSPGVEIHTGWSVMFLSRYGSKPFRALLRPWSGQKGHIQREYTNFENDQKLREKESELAKRQADMVVKLKSADLATRRDAKRDYLNERKEARAIAGDRFDRLTNAQKISLSANIVLGTVVLIP